MCTVEQKVAVEIFGAGDGSRWPALIRLALAPGVLVRIVVAKELTTGNKNPKPSDGSWLGKGGQLQTTSLFESNED